MPIEPEAGDQPPPTIERTDKRSTEIYDIAEVIEGPSPHKETFEPQACQTA